MFGSVLALILGMAVSSPILVPNLALAEKVQIEVDVVYAYFGVQEFSGNITGLWRNTDAPWELRLMSYFIVLNVTNRSGKTAMIDDFDGTAAEEIFVHSGNNVNRSIDVNVTTVAPRAPGDTLRLAENFQTSGEGFGITKINAIVSDTRNLRLPPPGWSLYWAPSESRLIGLTGMAEIPGLIYAVLMNGTVYLFGKAEGRAIGGSYSMGFSLKLVQLRIFGRELLYNAVLSENQMLRIYSNGLDVEIETRR